MLPTIAYIGCGVAAISTVATIGMQIFGPKSGLESLIVGVAMYLNLLVHVATLPVVGILLVCAGLAPEHQWVGLYYIAAGLHIGLTFAHWSKFWPKLRRRFRRAASPGPHRPRSSGRDGSSGELPARRSH